MKCYECGSIYQLKTDRYTFDDPYVGPISIEGKPYYNCNKCDEVLLTDEISSIIEEERDKRQRDILNEFPVSDFISVSDTLRFLGIARQALHKNHRINRGFIYQVKIGNVNLYLKQSVIRFKETGDGRFPLYQGNYYAPNEYVEETITLSPNLYAEPGSRNTQTISRSVSPYLQPTIKRIKSKKRKIYAN